jgi:hypothetical protein
METLLFNMHKNDDKSYINATYQKILRLGEQADDLPSSRISTVEKTDHKLIFRKK